MVPAALPIPRPLHVATLLLEEGLTILASSEATAVRCPVCDEPAERVHGRYARTLADLPWADLPVRPRVHARKFFCANPACPRRTFAERLTGIAPAHARRTDRQPAALTTIAFANGGEAGARVAAALGSPVGPDTRLRPIRGAPEAVYPMPAVRGVDDRAIHRGLTDGTILVDPERHRPVDPLPDRSSGSLAAWLRAHPGVEVIARDRAGADAEGARDGAPEAVQVAGRRRLADNLADALEARFRAKGTCLQAAAAALVTEAATTTAARPPPDAVYRGERRHPQPERWRERQAAAAAAGVARRRANYEQARALHANGACVAQIARTVGVSRMTVSEDLREGPPRRKRHTVHGRQRVLEPYEPYLLTRWEEGCHTATVLRREIRARGFAHSVGNVHRFVARVRRQGPPPAGRPRTALTQPGGPPPRHVAALVLRRPERRSDEQRAYLKRLAAEDPAIATAIDLAEDLLLMLRRREGERLAAWLDQAEASGCPLGDRRAEALRGQAAGGPGRRAGRADAAVEQRADGGPRQPPQAGQAPGLRAGRGRPAAQARAPGGLTGPRPGTPPPTLAPIHPKCGRPDMGSSALVVKLSAGFAGLADSGRRPAARPAEVPRGSRLPPRPAVAPLCGA